MSGESADMGMDMGMDDYIAANRRAWNAAAPAHRQQTFAGLLAAFQQPGYSYLDQVLTDLLSSIDLSGKAVAQLCCNNGRELLSVKNLGAARCVGFDISDAFLDQARELAAAARLDCHFVQTSVYDIAPDYDAAFDLVFLTVGALGWLPDLPRLFQVIRRILKPQGWLCLYEMHPILDMFDPEDQGDPPPLRYSYFRTEPVVEDIGLDYFGNTRYDAPPDYWFHHSLSDIIGGSLRHGFRLVSFQEYEHDLSSVFAHFEQFSIKPPLCYSLLARLENP